MKTDTSISNTSGREKQARLSDLLLGLGGGAAVTELSRDDYWALSRKVRSNKLEYNLRPQSGKLIELMVLDTYDQCRLVASYTEENKIREWARLLRCVDVKGYRFKTLNNLIFELRDLGLITLNEGQGTYELRPSLDDWSPIRALRGATRQAAAELPLSAERPLDAALAANSRDKALAGGGGPATVPAAQSLAGHDLLARLKQALANNASEQEMAALAEEARGILSAEKSADTQVAGNAVVVVSAEKSAEPIASLAFQKTASLAKASGKFSADEAFAWVSMVDRAGDISALQSRSVQAQWQETCERFPDYVLTKLRSIWEYESKRKDRTADQRIAKPLAWLSVKARTDRKMRRL